MNNQPITEEVLEQIGITPTAELLEHLNNTLQERVGAEITEALDDTQLEELVELQQTATTEDVKAWIENHVPEIEQIRQDNVDVLLSEIAENADGLNNSVSE